MLGSERVLAIVPARGGSKGIPKKNLQILGGKPLIEWTIRAAQSSELIDQILVTSDDKEILHVSEALGATCLIRPSHLATDQTAASDVILHALSKCSDFDIIIYLQPTSPFRTAQHIDEALRMLVDRRSYGHLGLVSVVKIDLIPEHMYRREENGLLAKLLPKKEIRRQETPETFLLNGAIFCAFMGDLIAAQGQFGLLDLISIVMSPNDSIDIDLPEDLEEARTKLSDRIEFERLGSRILE